MDRLSKSQRSDLMRRVTGKNTAPELVVRKLLHALGYRFRLHRPDLPGKPDIVLPGRNAVIFVHGCFWHGHTTCRRGARPTSNVEFWSNKIDGNRKRDRRNIAELKKNGYRVLVIWECQTKKPDVMTKRVTKFLTAHR